MAIRSFDQKFGKDFLKALPTCPAVYLVYDVSGQLIYVGKAINLRRRLSQYRNSKRRKKHRRMQGIVKEAARIEYRICDSHLDACLNETKLIQAHRPRWNIVGAYSFLYPMIGVRFENGNLSFCLTTTPDELAKAEPGFSFHGAYRSRRITGDAFFALMKLIAFVGHPNPRNRKNRIPKHSYVFSFRQLPENWAGLWGTFLKGESTDALEALILGLVENRGARRSKSKVQEQLDLVKRFWRHEVQTLARARKATKYAEYPVSQYQRDLVFLSYRVGVLSVDNGARAPRPSARQLQLNPE